MWESDEVVDNRIAVAGWRGAAWERGLQTAVRERVHRDLHASVWLIAVRRVGPNGRSRPDGRRSDSGKGQIRRAARAISPGNGTRFAAGRVRIASTVQPVLLDIW